jgi:hypothetical protein
MSCSSEMQSGRDDSTASPPTKIKDIHDCIDKMMLAVFEGARGHSAPSSSGERAQQMRESYEQSLEVIDRLLGVGRTKAEQEAQLAANETQLKLLRGEVLDLESKLRAVTDSIDVELESILSDEAIGLVKPDTGDS